MLGWKLVEKRRLEGASNYGTKCGYFRQDSDPKTEKLSIVESVAKGQLITIDAFRDFAIW